MKKKLLTLIVSILLILPIIVNADPLFLTVDKEEKKVAVGEDISFDIKLAKETEFDNIDIVYDQTALLRKSVVLTCGNAICPEEAIGSTYGKTENYIRVSLKNGYRSLNDELKITVTFKTLKDAETVVYAVGGDAGSFPMKATIGNPSNNATSDYCNPMYYDSDEGVSNYNPSDEPGGSYLNPRAVEKEEDGNNLNTIIMIISLVLNAVFAGLLVFYLIKVKKRSE